MPLTPSLFPRYPVHPHGKHSRNPVSHTHVWQVWCRALDGVSGKSFQALLLSRLLGVHGDVRAVVPVPLLAATAVTAQSCPFCPRTEYLAAVGSSFLLSIPPRSTPNATGWACTDAMRPHVEAGRGRLSSGLCFQANPACSSGAPLLQRRECGAGNTGCIGTIRGHTGTPKCQGQPRATRIGHFPPPPEYWRGRWGQPAPAEAPSPGSWSARPRETTTWCLPVRHQFTKQFSNRSQFGKFQGEAMYRERGWPGCGHGGRAALKEDRLATVGNPLMEGGRRGVAHPGWHGVGRWEHGTWL